MNKIGLNILLVLLLTGCSMFNSQKRNDSNGEPVGRNAPIFISQKKNENAPNNTKQNTNAPTVNKPATVQFNAEKYIMIKENDLNMLVNQKTNEALLNIKNSNANEKEPNKALDAAIDNQIKNSVPPTIVNFTPNPIKLEPVIEQEKPSRPSIHPIFSYIMTTLIILAFILAVGYFFFFKKKAQNETPAQDSPKVATETTTEAAAENHSNQDPETKKD